jgi:hypothetical protein
VAAALLCTVAVPALAEDGEEDNYGRYPVTAKPSAMAMLFDGLVARPVGIATTLLGTGLFVVTLPFSASGGNVDAARERFIDESVDYTFQRCLGCFDDDFGTDLR